MPNYAPGNAGPYPGIASNPTFARLPNWFKALGQARAKSASANLFIIGSSSTAGYGAAGNAGIGARPLSYPPTLVANMVAAGVSITDGGFFSDQNVSINNITGPQYDPRVVYGSGWATSSSSAVCGSSIANTTTTNPLSFTPAAAFDTVDVYYFAPPSGGTFTTNVDGGASLGSTNTYAATRTISKVTYTVPLGTHTINVAATSGSAVYIFGMNTYNSAVKGLRMFQLGSCGAKAIDFTSINFQYYSFQTLAALCSPIMTIIDLGINDWITGTALPSFVSQMQTVISTAKLTGDCALVAGTPTAIATTPAATQLTYIAAMQQLAVTNNIPLLDFHKRWGSYETLNPLGFYFDQVHPLAVGYNDLASFISNALLNASAL